MAKDSMGILQEPEPTAPEEREKPSLWKEKEPKKTKKPEKTPDSLGILEDTEPKKAEETPDSLGILENLEKAKEPQEETIEFGGGEPSDPGATRSTERVQGTTLSTLEKQKMAHDARKEAIESAIEAPDVVGVGPGQGEAALEEMGERPEQKSVGEQLQQVPKETAGLVGRPLASTGEMVDRGIASISDMMGFGDTADYWRDQADYMEDVNRKLKTDLTDPRFDLAASLALGAAGGGASYAAMAKNIPKALRGARALGSSASQSGIMAAGADYGINRVMERIDPLLKKSGMSPVTQDVIRAALDLGMGFASAGTLEARFAKMLDDPMFARDIDRLVQKGAPPEMIMERWKKTGPASEWSPEISREQLRKLNRKRTQKGMDPIEGGQPKPRIQTTRQKKFLIDEEEGPPQAKKTQKREELTPAQQKQKTAMGRGGPAAGAGALVGVEKDEEGNISIDPKKALLGAAGTVAVGGSAMKLTRPGRELARDIATKWDSRVAQPILDTMKTQVNKRITNEEFRRWWGMGRDQQMKDLMRNYNREIDAISDRALQMGRELQEVAPTAAEQKRLLQVLRGSVTANKEMARKAEKFQKLFQGLDQNTKELKLREYGMFDKLTRAERAKIRNKINEIDTSQLDAPEDFLRAAERAEVDLGPTLQRDLKARDPEVFELARQSAREKIQKALDFDRQRLRDHYHHGSAEEYMPLKYRAYEDFSQQEKKELNRQLKELKKQSRSATPEGVQDLEAQIAFLEDVLRKGRFKPKSKKTQLDMGPTMRRQDLPGDVQRVLGRIDEAPFPVAKGARQQMANVAKGQLFKEIADNPAWAFKASRGQDVPANFVKVTDERMGDLKGMHVRKDIYEDLKEDIELPNDMMQLWDKGMGLWKVGKVVMNPATHARNFYSNAILAYLGDVHPGDLKTYGQAAKEIKQGGNYYQEAQDWGLFRNTFAKAELADFRDEIGALRNGKQLQNKIRKAASAPSWAYQKNEEFFKMAVYTKARNQGASVDEAARKAEKFLFNYGDIPPAVRQIKRFWSPFFTFTYKALPLAGEMAIRKPWKIGMLSAGAVASEEYAKGKFGRSDEEQEAREKGLPGWQQGFTNVLMPFKDQHGNDLYLDLGYILPYGEAIGAEQWGRSKWIPDQASPVLPKHPLLNTMSTFFLNKDPLTGRKIFYEYSDTAKDTAEKVLGQAWKELAPTLFPGGHSFNRIKDAFVNKAFREEGNKIKRWNGDPKNMHNAILHSFLGIRLSPANEEELRKNLADERTKAKKQFETKKRELQRRRRRNKIGPETYKKKMRQLMEQKQEVMQSLQMKAD